MHENIANIHMQYLYMLLYFFCKELYTEHLFHYCSSGTNITNSYFNDLLPNNVCNHFKCNKYHKIYSIIRFEI